MMAREIRMKKGWLEVSPKESELVLVVCRSALLNPLDYSYTSFAELSDAAEHQLNIAGLNFHIYLFRFNSDLSLSEASHTSFPANK